MYDGQAQQDGRKKSVVVLGVIIVVVGIVLIVFGYVGRGGIVSPIPDDGSVRIIFVTPTPEAAFDASESGEIEEDLNEQEENSE